MELDQTATGTGRTHPQRHAMRNTLSARHPACGALDVPGAPHQDARDRQQNHRLPGAPTQRPGFSNRRQLCQYGLFDRPQRSGTFGSQTQSHGYAPGQTGIRQ